MNTNKNIVRTAVQREMARRGLTITCLADRSGVARPNLNNWLNGKRSLSLKCAERLLATLGLVVQPAAEAETCPDSRPADNPNLRQVAG